MPKIERLDRARLGDENIRRLQIAAHESCECANETAALICKNNRSRFVTFKFPSSQYSSSDLPETNSIAKYDVAVRAYSAVEKPRDVRVIEGGENLPLVAKGRSVASESMPRLRILSATVCEKSSRIRTALKTTPMRPRPISPRIL